MGGAVSVSWTIVTWTGLALAIVGWTDLALLWYPPGFGSAQWEFGTISAHIDGQPLGTIGLAAFGAGALALRKRILARGVAVVCWLVAAALLCAVALYGLDALVAFDATAPATRAALKKAILKTAIASFTYIVLYAWLGFFLWRNSRSSGAGILLSK